MKSHCITLMEESNTVKSSVTDKTLGVMLRAGLARAAWVPGSLLSGRLQPLSDRWRVSGLRELQQDHRERADRSVLGESLTWVFWNESLANCDVFDQCIIIFWTQLHAILGVGIK